LHEGLTKEATMGLDAYVRCRCFEEGKLKPGPVPAEDLYIDEDGYLSSRMLDKEYERLGYERFYETYEELNCAFLDWCDTCCEHESGEYCSERVANIAGCAEFRELVEEVGGEERFPLLSHLLPDGNGGDVSGEQGAGHPRRARQVHRGHLRS
jgi:hypothetical protein